MNEDEELAIYNGFYGSLVGEEKVKEMLLKWNEGPFLFSIINLETNEFMGQVSFFGIYEMYKKFGFKECGRWHQVRYHDGISQDIILMELLREEYIK